MGWRVEGVCGEEEEEGEAGACVRVALFFPFAVEQRTQQMRECRACGVSLRERCFSLLPLPLTPRRASSFFF